MKILFIVQSLGKGGAERLVLDLARAIPKLNPEFQVRIVSLSQRNDYKELSEGLDIVNCDSQIKLSISGKSNIEISDFERIVSDFQPDIIHSHTYKAELVSRENPRMGAAYFTHVHADFPEFETFSIKTLFSKKLLANYYERRRIFKKYRAVNNQFITISKAIDDHLKKQLPKSGYSSVHLIPNGIDIQKFKAEPRELDLKEKIRFVSVGRLFPVKNHDYMIRAMAIFKDQHPELDWELNILGEGSERPYLEALIKKLDLENHIFLQGLIHNVEDWLKTSHVYLHTANYEPFGLVLCEAMAAGLPIISLDAGGNRDIIENGENGYVLDAKTAHESFSKSVFELINDKGLYSRMARKAFESANRFGIEDCAKKLVELYKLRISETKER